MELLNGSDLERLIEKQGRIAPENALRYLTQVARALDKAHSQGIVHRDLKPENIFLHHREDGSEVVKILDFGISKIVKGADGGADLGSAGMTNTGAVMGTPLYMAPEQARGRVSQIAPATDVWAMGLIAIRLLTGEIYWRANTVGELMALIISDPMYPPTERWAWLPAGVDAWFARSCAREPTQRFPTVGEQVQALAAAFGQHIATGPQSSLPRGAEQASLGVVTAGVPAGARTTGATTADAQMTVPRSRAPLVVGGVVAVLAVAAGGVGLWARAHQASQVAQEPSTQASAEVAPSGTAASTAVVPAASAAPSSAVGVAPSAVASVQTPDAGAVAAAGDNRHRGAAVRPGASAHQAAQAAAQPGPQAQPPPPPPPPVSPPPAHTGAAAPFNPAAP
jgi:hypothetical protein